MRRENEDLRNDFHVNSSSNNAAAVESPILVNQDGSISFPFAILLVGVLLALSGQWLLGFLTILVGFTVAVCHAAMDQIPEEEKQDIRYNVLGPEEILQELIILEEEEAATSQNNDNENNDTRQQEQRQLRRQKCRVHFIAGLEAMAKKYGTQKQLEKSATMHPQQQQQAPTKKNIGTSNHDLELMCQHVAYTAYRLFPKNDDQVIAAALSLHALVAKDPQVRQRHLQEADLYGLNLPVQCMRDALIQAKLETNPDREQQMAELQRKACLLLGALGDGDADFATKIVEEDGLEAVIDTANWYRYHEDVANWALWAVFILSYENPPNKVRNVQLGGVVIILQTMKNVPDCLEVARHGVAVLFDLMRDNAVNDGEEQQQQHSQLDVWTIRKSALASGLHQIILQTMTRFSGTIDIMMMGQEILAGTDYRGQVPQYQPKSDDVAG